MPQQALADWVRRDYTELTGAVRRPAGGGGLGAGRTYPRLRRRGAGRGPLAGEHAPRERALLRRAELDRAEPRFPLSLRLCEGCGMVQLGHVVPPELLFRSYLFFTSASGRMSEHFSALITEAADEFVPPGGLIVEIGSNDGTGLASTRRRDVRMLGVDPARNVAVMAASRGVPTISEFFTETLAREVSRVAGRARLVVACNVLGHIDDLEDVLRGVRTLLAPDGGFVFEVPYLGEFLRRSEYDTIYHEHLSYFAVRPLVALLNRHGLRLDRVELFPVHGGTIRGTAVPGDGCSPQVEEWLADEAEKGFADRRTFGAMASRVADDRVALRRTLAELRDAGVKVAGYGAPAKGTVVLNYCGIGTDLLPFVVDTTPAKQGCFVPGTHQPIFPTSALERERPDVLLLLAWNHAEEVRAPRVRLPGPRRPVHRAPLGGRRPAGPATCPGRPASGPPPAPLRLDKRADASPTSPTYLSIQGLHDFEVERHHGTLDDTTLAMRPSYRPGPGHPTRVPTPWRSSRRADPRPERPRYATLIHWVSSQCAQINPCSGAAAGRPGRGRTGRPRASRPWRGATLLTVPTLSIGDVRQVEGDCGTTEFKFNLTLSEPTQSYVVLTYETVARTATPADGDYVPVPDSTATPVVNGVAYFNPGETSKPLIIKVNGDTKADSTRPSRSASPTPSTRRWPRRRGWGRSSTTTPPW